VPVPNDTVKFSEEVRAWLRDFPELNRLLAGEESSPRMVQFCAHMALDEWNAYSPVQFGSVGAFPNKTILIQLTVIYILMSAGILHSRNRFDFNSGGFVADTERQADEYPKWIQLIRAQLAGLMKNLSIRLNISSASGGGGVPSEYSMLHNWYGWA